MNEKQVVLIITLGICIIIFGYWSKWYVYWMNRSSELVEEAGRKTREKRASKEKLTLNQKLTLWVEDGKGIKLCNKIGLTLIIIGFLLILINLYIFK